MKNDTSIGVGEEISLIGWDIVYWVYATDTGLVEEDYTLTHVYISNIFYVHNCGI